MFAFKDKSSPAFSAHRDPTAKNNTGIPIRLKDRIERLSGYSMDDVKIHYNSAKPSQIQALAYTQSNNVYLGAGQEKHLGHELWHVVQQKQGRVMPTAQVNGLPVNDNAALEREADHYGRNMTPLMPENTPKILSDSPAPGGNTLQRFTENEVSYNTVGEYYQFLCNTERTKIQDHGKDFLDERTAAFSEDFIFKIDISTCNSWSDVEKTIEDNLSQNQEELLSAVFALYKGSMYPNMNFKETEVLDKTIFAGNFKLIRQYVPKFRLFKPMYYHENLDRARDPGSSEPIDPYDISDEFVPGKSCVITALFHAESELISNEFHAENVAQFHKVLVSSFKRNQYTDDTEATEHQKNSVWKNYSDDSVYPSLYAYFGYKPLNKHECQNVNLGTAIINGKLPRIKGMICVEGHMLYFDNTKNPPSFFDNDSGPNAPSPANKAKKIKCIYYKS